MRAIRGKPRRSCIGGSCNTILGTRQDTDIYGDCIILGNYPYADRQMLKCKRNSRQKIFARFKSRLIGVLQAASVIDNLLENMLHAYPLFG